MDASAGIRRNGSSFRGVVVSGLREPDTLRRESQITEVKPVLPLSTKALAKVDSIKGRHKLIFMKRFEITANDTGKFWVSSNITGRLYFVELIMGGREDKKALFTRILIRNEHEADKLRKCVLQLSSEINPLPIIEQLDKMSN